MTQASCKTTINMPADAIWRVISDFGAACKYLVMVDDCSVAGQGIGALRTLTGADGSTIVERLESLDAAARRLSYALFDEHALSPNSDNYDGARAGSEPSRTGMVGILRSRWASGRGGAGAVGRCAGGQLPRAEAVHGGW